MSTYFDKINKYTGLSWPGWSPVLIHGAGFVLLTAMTVHNFLPLLTDYQDRNVAIEINIIVPKVNDTIPRPSTSVCIPYYSGAIPNLARWLAMGAEAELVELGASMERDAMTNHSWDVWNRWNISEDERSMMSEDEFRTRLIVDLIMKLLDEGDFDDPLEFRPINLNWNQAIVDAVWQFLGCMTDVDTFYIVGDSSLHTTCLEIAALSDLDGVRDLLELFYDKVINATMIYFDIAYRLSADSPIIYPPDLIRHRPVYLFHDNFCFEVATDVTVESYAYSPYVHNDLWPYPWQRFRRSRAYSVVMPGRSVFASIETAIYLYMTTVDHLTNPEINEEQVHLVYQIDSTVRERRPEKLKTCSWDPVPEACIVRRQIERSIEYCGCRPFTFRFLTSPTSSSTNTYSHNRTVPYCTKRIYESCNRTLQANLDRIREECNDRCEYVTFKWQKRETIRDNSMRSGLAFHVEMIPFKEVYREFSRIVRDSPDKFVSQIGGIVGLYFGISGCSFCALLASCVRSYDRYKRLHRRNAADSIENDGGGNKRTEAQTSGERPMYITRRRSHGDTMADDIRFGFGCARGGHGGSGQGHHHTVMGGQMASVQRQLDELVREMKIVKERQGLKTGSEESYARNGLELVMERV